MPSRPLRILQVINSLDPRQGGTVECALQLGACFTERGHAVEMAACGDAPGAPWLEATALRSHALGAGRGSYAYAPRLKSFIAANADRLDAVIIHGLWQYQGLGASRAAIAHRIPYFVYPHGMLDPWNRGAHPLKYAKKWLYWLAVERATLERAQAVVFTSPQEEALARRYFHSARWTPLVSGCGIAPPPGPDASAVRAVRSRFGLHEGQRAWLYLGRLHPKKGLDTLIEAFAALAPAARDIQLWVVGEGEPAYVARLKASAERAGVGTRIAWCGPLYRDAKWPAIAAAELLVLPSRQENFGMVLAEALALGTPVCTTTGVNVHEAISRHQAGFVSGCDADSLRQALSRWLALDADGRASLSRNARRCYEAEFRIDAAVDKLLAAMHEALEARHEHPQGVRSVAHP